MCPSNATGMKTLGSALRSPPSSQITPRGNLGRGDARVLELTEPSAGLGLGAPPLCRKGAWIFLEKPPLSAAGPVATPGHLGPTRLCARAGIGIVREKKPLSLGARGLQDGNPWSPITGETGTPGRQSLGRRERLVPNHWGDGDAWSAITGETGTPGPLRMKQVPCPGKQSWEVGTCCGSSACGPVGKSFLGVQGACLANIPFSEALGTEVQ